uniref:Uncharacterized protein n=1 Tax=Globodera rostochiensis TaxID=31243 RepID=A0A914HVN6_GLORO
MCRKNLLHLYKRCVQWMEVRVYMCAPTPFPARPPCPTSNWGRTPECCCVCGAPDPLPSLEMAHLSADRPSTDGGGCIRLESA